MKIIDHPATDSALRAPPSTLAIIALGSNLGDSRQVVSEAMVRLSKMSNQPAQKSSLWQTSPVACPPGSAPFVNAVMALVPFADETPESLLKKLRALEKKAGREAKLILNEPRVLDLDLIAFAGETRNTPALILPHPRTHLRRFVLQPLSEIAAGFILPGQSKTVAQLLAGLPETETVTRLA